MKELIERLDNWLREYRIDFYGELNKSATDKEIEQIENEAGLSLPPEFKELLLWKNGQSSDCLATFHPLSNEMFVSSTSMVNDMKEMKELLKYGDIEKWSSSWAPFLDNGGGDMTSIDLSTGEIVTRDHETEEIVILYKNIYLWLSDLVQVLSTNNFSEWDIVECRKNS